MLPPFDRLMDKDTKHPAPKPPKNIEVGVKNPRYEGATIEMVVKAMLQRPKKTNQEQVSDPENSEEPREIKR